MSSKTPKLNLKLATDNITKSVSKQISDIASTKKAKQVLTSNNWLAWTLRIVLILYASFGAINLNSGLAHIFDNIIVRLIISGLIIYLCYVDPSSAILLAVGFVISIQTLNKHKISQASYQLNESFEGQEPDLEMSDSFVGEYIKEDSENNRLDDEHLEHSELPILGETSQQPMIQNQSTFTSDQQLIDAQTNQAKTNNQNTQVQTFERQLGPQGIGDPSGFNLETAGNFANFD